MSRFSMILVVCFAMCVITPFFNFIPSWVEIQSKIMAILYLIFFVLVLIFTFLSWLKTHNSDNTPTKYYLIKNLALTFFSLVIAPIVFLYSVFLLPAVGIKPRPIFILFSTELQQKLTLESKTIYVYIESCVIPDSKCECDNYRSIVFIQNDYLPIMHLVAKADFFIGEIIKFNNKLLLVASNECERDIGKKRLVEF